MKRVILAIILVLSVTSSYSQKKNVNKAKNKALMEIPDFAGARADIKLALEDATTKDLASTWHTAGLIGYKENDAEIKKQMLNQKFDADVKGKAIVESYNYYIKAYELDGLPDAKGKVKPKFQKDIKAKIKEYYATQANLVAYGAHLFDKKKYAETVNAFEIYLGIPKLPMMNNEIKLDSTYFMIKYYTGIAAANAGNHDKAILYYEDLKDDGYEELTVHQLLYDEYLKRKDTVNFVKTLKAGFEKFPSEAWFLQNLINYYIYSGQTQAALVYLNSAIDREPNMAQYQYVKGNLAESMGKLDEARAAFDRAIELDNTIADAYAGIGRLYFNKAVKMADEANDIKDLKLYNAAKKKADGVFDESRPYFKKAAELKPDEIEYKRTLKTLYYRLRMNKEFEAIEKELNQ
ncbi:MAG: tetratricopeptide repeat protein [Paludibacter sp.]|nr:tetratricopeptide repeat protein [Paludibacter sp.]